MAKWKDEREVGGKGEGGGKGKERRDKKER